MGAIGVSLAALMLAGAGSASAASGHALVDFDGDGEPDSAYGATGEARGAIYVSLGDGSAFRLGGEDYSGALYLGTAMATCDVDADGFTDLVAGDPFATDAEAPLDGAGAIYVFYGAPTPFTQVQKVSQATSGIAGSSEKFDQMGAAVACGRVGTDAYADVLVGIPFEGLGSTTQAGSAVYIPGGASGLVPGSSSAVHQDTAGIASVAEAFDYFGWSVAIGDVTGDARGDLLIGVPGENNGVGQVHSLRGTSSGWTPTSSSVIFGGTVDAAGSFGYTMSLGSFDGSGALDLAVGAPADGGGSVTVLKGTSTNLSATGERTFTQATSGVPGSDEGGDGFGTALDAGDLTGDGRDDLLIGIPGEDLGSSLNAGAVALLRGTSTGLSTSSAQAMSQDSTDVVGVAESADEFGRSVTVLDSSGDGFLDAAVGSTSEDLGSITDAGTATVLLGSSAGLSGTGSVSLDAGDLGGALRSAAMFGASGAG